MITPRVGRAALLLVPLLLYELIVFIIPHLLFIRTSLYAYAGPTLVGDTLTFENYTKLAADPYYRRVFLQSFQIVLLITLGCIIIGYPVSYVIARSRRWGAIILVVVVGSAFTSAVVRTLGWLMLFSETGPISQLTQLLGFRPGEIKLLHSTTAVVIGMIHVELPYMVLACIAPLMAIPIQLEEAAEGLGAGWLRTMRQVILPLSWPGIVAGSLLVIATSAASFTTPAILGGQLVPYVPIVITTQMTTGLNYPLAASLGVVLGLIVIACSLAASAWSVTRLKEQRAT